MIEGRCASCNHWTDFRSLEQRDWRTDESGKCNCDKFTYDGLTALDGLNYLDAAHYAASFSTGREFGCVHWKEREPDLREQLAEYIDGMVSHYIPSGRWEWKKERGPRVADEIIAMFEKHQS